MVQLFALISLIGLVLGIVRNLRLLLVLGAVGSAGFFGYLVYHGLDAGLAFDAVADFWSGVVEFFRRGFSWGKGMFPF